MSEGFIAADFKRYPRDLIGYGADKPHADWPDGARIALQFVVNYEEGGENCILHGDEASEAFLSEITADAREGVRHMSMESFYEYGSRVGVWRLFNLFKDFEIPVTIFAIAMALQRNPDVVEAALKNNFELCSHGYRWIDYQYLPENIEKEHLYKAIEIHTEVTGERPLGWYTGRTSPNTRRLIAEEGGFLYDADDYSDELPFWSKTVDQPHLIVPYSLDANDMRFAATAGFTAGDQFYNYLKNSFDTLYDEGETAPKMMSIGLHCRVVGRPGRFQALKKFVEYARSRDKVWFCRRVDIARHWREHHPYTEAA
ncbi:MAG: allantoinase PuuE [Rhodospirillales bacterium]|nr:allantoinase PuuE [Rhodospirillales bacterium]MDP7424384.1 allantoinase PuuE [Rhodospirillales bacterium]MDP7623482.1 allantoinase PuuE [Rhodospirillales bacterium]HJO87326.1 allantoinase PuuE [Rhodospirillales bacterium]